MNSCAILGNNCTRIHVITYTNFYHHVTINLSCINFVPPVVSKLDYTVCICTHVLKLYNTANSLWNFNQVCGHVTCLPLFLSHYALVMILLPVIVSAYYYTFSKKFGTKIIIIFEPHPIVQSEYAFYSRLYTCDPKLFSIIR